MQHIRFMDNSQTVCNYPDRLADLDTAVIIDPAGEDSCRECPALLIAHNTREFEKEQALIPSVFKYHPRVESDMGCIRGALYGGAAATGFWLVMTLITWWLMR